MRTRSDTPGLKRLKRQGGRIDLYWVADKAALKLGYPTKTVRLFGDLADPVAYRTIADHCDRLQTEMLQWLDGIRGQRNDKPVATLAWFCSAFETDEDSPFHALRHATQIFYSRYIAQVVDMAEQTDVAVINGKMVRGWHRGWKEALGERSAYACIQTLRRVVGYGCELGDDACLRLAQILERTEFKTPKRRKTRATHEMVAALRPVAIRQSRTSIALATTFQFALHLRQKDVIGEWVPIPKEKRHEAVGGIVDGGSAWSWGLTWDHVDAEWILRKPTSKSNGSEVAEHDLKLHPDLLVLLQAFPKDVRIGPIIRDERSGLPWRPSHFSRTFRALAREAGWPDAVWNMDSRAGAVSESFEAGADPADVMKAATHRQITTTMGYNRGGLEQTSRVAVLRTKHRKQT